MSLTVVHKSDHVDPSVKPRQFHTCNVCGRTGVWDENWASKLVALGKGYTGWEEYFKVCSIECEKKIKAENLIEKFKRQKDPEYRKKKEKQKVKP